MSNNYRIEPRTFLLLRQWSERQPSVQEQIREARAGDKDEARNILERFCAHLETRQAPPEVIADYVAGALRAVLAGNEPKKALGLTTPGRPRQSRFLRKQLAAHVFLLMSAGQTKEVAAEWVAAGIADQLSCWRSIEDQIRRGVPLDEARETALRDVGLPAHRLMPREDVEAWYRLSVTAEKAADCYDEFRAEIEQLLT
jgi:hypothetical protein